MYNFVLFILGTIGIYHGVYKERPQTVPRREQRMSIDKPKQKQQNKMRIVTIGDSITQGYLRNNGTIEVYSNLTWPMRLTEMINDDKKYELINYGKSAKCAQKKKDCSYWDTVEYEMALLSEPDIVTIMFGTNDAYESNWEEQQFRSDYTELALSFKNLESKPQVYLLIPPPAYENSYMGKKLNNTAIDFVFPRFIPEIAQDIQAMGVVNVHHSMGGVNHEHYEYFCNGQNCDTIHPNNAGYYRLASTVYGQIFGPGMNNDPLNPKW